MTFGPVLDRDFDILRELWVSLVVNYIYDISLMTVDELSVKYHFPILNANP